MTDFLQILIWQTKLLRNEALSQCEQITREVEKTSTDDMTDASIGLNIVGSGDTKA